MKLTNISIEEFSHGRNLDLSNLSSGLNVIYGANGTGKSSIRRFLRGMLLQANGEADPSGLYNDLQKFGSLDVLDKSQRLRIAHRNLANGSRFYIESLHNDPRSANERTQIPKCFDRDTYDQILNIDFCDNPDDVQALVSVLTNRFGVKRGNLDKPLVDISTIRQRESALANLRDLIADLNRRSEYLSRQINERNTGNRAEIESLIRHITDLSERIAALESLIATSLNRLRDLDIEIDDLRLHIERLRNQVHSIKLRRDTSRVPALLSHLEAIEQQIARWRKVHGDVQSQRNKLRDEMAAWVSNEHNKVADLPFEESRELLDSLEQRVSDLEGYVNRMQRIIPRRETEQQAALIPGSMQKSLSSMREEVHQLCRQLQAQHLVFRQKAAVNELKQLRRCYLEVADHLQRLSVRRDALIQEISKLDPARADLILNAGHDRCEYSTDHNEFFRELPMNHQADYRNRRVDIDVSSELARLQQLESDRQHLHGEIEINTVDLNELTRRRHELIQRREALKLNDAEALRRELAELERRLPEEKRRFTELQKQLDLDRQAASYRPNVLLDQAGRYLDRMSRGDLTRIWISPSENDLIALDSKGKRTGYAALSRSGKDQIRLAISLAAASALAAQGAYVPLVLDDSFVNLDDDATRRGSEALLEFCQADHQVILFTCRRYVADLLSRPGVAVLDLPDYHFAETTRPTPRYAAAIAPLGVSSPDSDDAWPLRSIDSSLNLYNEGHSYDYIEPQVISTETLVETARYLHDDSATEPNADTSETLAEIAERPPRENPLRPRDLEKVVDEATHLADTRLMGNDNIAQLRRIGVRTVGDLLNFDPSEKQQSLLEEDLDLEDIEAWQSQALLMIAVPQLRATDALMLYSCGIHHPEMLATIEADDLSARVRQFAQSTRGSRMLNSGYTYDSSRLKTWMNTARTNRDRYANRQSTARSWSRRDSQGGDRNQAVSSLNGTGSDYARERSFRDATSRGLRANANTSGATKRSEKNKSATATPVKFYLDLSSSVESAPSIGPRTGEKLEKIGIMTVQDLLDTPAQEIAKGLNYKRIKPQDIQAWQQQATLVCRVPQIRGHDAQFLVACGITEPEQLAAMDPHELYQIIGPFAKTTEGQKISRAGKSPDLAEVTDWINWSQQTRMLKAG